jgi:hypothetical protein
MRVEHRGARARRLVEERFCCTRVHGRLIVPVSSYW